MTPSSEAQELDATRIRRWALPAPSDEHGKEERGAVLLVGGSAEIPGAAILVTVLAVYVVGERLRAAVDPRLRLPG